MPYIDTTRGPAIGNLCKNYKTAIKLPKEEHLSVDEQTVPFKGKSCLRQFNSKKNTQVGLQALGALWSKWLCLFCFVCCLNYVEKNRGLRIYPMLRVLLVDLCLKYRDVI